MGCDWRRDQPDARPAQRRQTAALPLCHPERPGTRHRIRKQEHPDRGRIRHNRRRGPLRLHARHPSRQYRTVAPGHRIRLRLRQGDLRMPGLPYPRPRLNALRIRPEKAVDRPGRSAAKPKQKGRAPSGKARPKRKAPSRSRPARATAKKTTPRPATKRATATKRAAPTRKPAKRSREPATKTAYLTGARR